METFATNLKRRALELGVSNAEIARRLGISERRYAHYVRGDREPDLATLVRITAILQATADELLGLDEPRARGPRDLLRDNLNLAIDELNDRDLALIVAQVGAAVEFVRAEPH